jgi:hypothetical protein
MIENQYLHVLIEHDGTVGLFSTTYNLYLIYIFFTDNIKSTRNERDQMCIKRSQSNV